MANVNSRNGAVGYKQPPAHTRFKKGRSGNPNGRPKGNRAGNTLAEVVNRTVAMTLDGTPCKVPLTEALVMSLAQRALAGNNVAAREFLKIAEKVAAEQKAAEEKDLPPVQFELVPLVAKHCDKALEKLQVMDGWRIQTWVIEAALARNNQLLRDETDRRLIEVNMINPEDLEAILPKAA
jgi:hypothetical protein